MHQAAIHKCALTLHFLYIVKNGCTRNWSSSFLVLLAVFPFIDIECVRWACVEVYFFIASAFRFLVFSVMFSTLRHIFFFLLRTINSQCWQFTFSLTATYCFCTKTLGVFVIFILKTMRLLNVMLTIHRQIHRHYLFCCCCFLCVRA